MEGLFNPDDRDVLVLWDFLTNNFQALFLVAGCDDNLKECYVYQSWLPFNCKIVFINPPLVIKN